MAVSFRTPVELRSSMYGFWGFRTILRALPPSIFVRPLHRMSKDRLLADASVSVDSRPIRLAGSVRPPPSVGCQTGSVLRPSLTQQSLSGWPSLGRRRPSVGRPCMFAGRLSDVGPSSFVGLSDHLWPFVGIVERLSSVWLLPPAGRVSVGCPIASSVHWLFGWPSTVSVIHRLVFVQRRLRS